MVPIPLQKLGGDSKDPVSIAGFEPILGLLSERFISATLVQFLIESSGILLIPSILLNGG